ncbi:hypothetical protein [Pelagicoccus sp. SDUM812003]|uniref:hypothetical protein n=1 Tax=Pelagicoccus sp. SDUM812003 TaxID=3041267 RepID=UPI00280C7070|nr:hypothetical protein [Pelagicoccus sp. SDUM812003]MDQ8204803.1 hypothetical protein [Pelagicoccus sp. SDUM812003]
MSDLTDNENEVEIVDLDTCSKKKSILIGALVTLLLGLVPFSYVLLLGHYLLGGLAAVGHFAKRHKITIAGFQGVKIGAMAAFLGMLPAFGLFSYQAMQLTEEDIAPIREEAVQDAYESGQPEAVEVLEKLMVVDNIPSMLGVCFVIVGLGSLALGSLGGLIGASVFKKGPLAQ